MSFLNILLIAVALSFDAMLVAAANGAAHHKMSFSKAFQIAFFFGLFQLFMPVIGWLIGSGFGRFISEFDHWFAFALLCGLGIKMIVESFGKVDEKKIDINSWKVLFLLAVATSIDALVVGMTFAVIPVNIFLTVIIIGAITFFLSLISIYIGKKSGKILGNKAEIIGGLLLIGIGFKILLSHLLS